MKNDDVKVYRASKKLIEKAGTGEIRKEVIEKSQKAIESNKVDFSAFAKEHILKLAEVIERAKGGNFTPEELRQGVIAPVLQLKSSGTIFGYQLVSTLAGTMVNFLDSVNVVDKSVIAIVDAHRVTLTAIIANNMTGDGGAYGQQINSELNDVCSRYLEKANAVKS
jgi:hypothetical protein